MENKCSISTLLIILFTAFLINAADLPEGISIEQTGSDYLVNFTLPNFQIESKNIEGEEFYLLKIEGYGEYRTIGKPSLPIVSFNLIIPDGHFTPEVQITGINENTELLGSKVFPFQEPWPKSEPIENRPFTIDRDYYSTQGDFSKSLVTISDPYIIRGLTGVTVTIRPLAYNPSANLLKIIQSASVLIKLNNTVEQTQNYSNNFNAYFDKVFVNFNQGAETKSMNYVIITAPEFEADLAGFVSHKQSRGYNVSLYNTSTAGTTTSAIKMFLQGLYDNPATTPEFVLLVGDVDKVPAWTGSGTSSPTTDLYYVLLDGTDYYSDAFIGRFSVTNTSQLSNAISKSIYMENNIATLDKKNIFMASTDNYSISEGTHNYVINNYFEPDGYTNLKLYTVTYNATTAQLIAALNDNQQFAIYSGHGGTTSWADGPQLNQSQVSGLTNTVYPFVYSFACITGTFDYTECFGETWLRADHGASSFYGSSVNSFWDEDDILEKELFKSMFVDGLTRVTPMFDQGKIYLATHYGGSVTPGSDLLRYIEMYNLMGDPSLPTKLQILPDSTAPEPITDLAINDQTSNSIQLSWTAPYDSTTGGIASYDIRYSLTDITNDADFQNAAQIIYGGNSDSAGTSKTFTVPNLDFGTTYFFAAKAQDIWSNASAMSNVISGPTYEAPQINVTPNQMLCNLFQNSSTTDTIFVSNISTGNSTLNYSIELANHVFPGIVNAHLVSLPNDVEPVKNDDKSMETIFTGGASIKGSGGPDLFGYEWIDSDDPSGPDYVWNDISATGTAVTNWVATGTFDPKDEGVAGPLAIGFPFKFYGETKTELYISTNGFITFQNITSNAFSNASIPTSGEPNELIAPFWDDLDGRSQGEVYYLVDGNKFIIQFNNWQKYSGTGSLTFQVVLYSNGKINIYYSNMNASLNSSTVGIENADGSDGLLVAYNSSYISDGLAVQFAAEPDWLAINNLGGTLYNGNNAIVVLDISCDGLELGTYSMDCIITSNDPANGSVTVPITMIVSDDVPVELSLFDVQEHDGEVYINWETATETNNAGFAIQRKLISDESWKEIAFMDGKGTTAEKSNYGYSDKLSVPGQYSYRLKQVDFDGTTSYSKIVEITFDGPDNYELSQNYPNPFNPATTIKFSLPEENHVKIEVFNSLGQKVAELLNAKMEIGYHEVDFKADNLSSGIFYYRIESGDFVDVKKMMFIK